MEGLLTDNKGKPGLENIDWGNLFKKYMGEVLPFSLEN